MCNLDCEYCYEKIDDINGKMKTLTAKKVLEFILAKNIKNKPKKIYITFHGGEPLLGIDIIEYFIHQIAISEEFQDVDISYSLTTNATLYERSMLPVLRKISDLSVSIDGNKSTHDSKRKFKNGKGTFDVVFKNLKELLKEKIDISARLVVTNSTYLDIYDNFIFLIQNGIRDMSIIMDFVDFNWSDKQISEYTILLKKILYKTNQYRQDGIIIKTGLIQNGLMKVKNHACDGGRGTFSILSSGDIYPCIVAVNDKKLCMGTVGGDFSDALTKEIKEMDKKVINKCKGCSRYEYCTSTRCRILNKILSGDYLEPSPINCATQRISMDLSRYVLYNRIPVNDL